MATYYKGELVFFDEIKPLDYRKKIAHLDGYGSVKLWKYFESNNEKNKEIMFDILSERNLKYNDNETEVNGKITEVFDEEFQENNHRIQMQDYYHCLEIIYELVKGNDNVYYAKELYSGLIFPIGLMDNIFISYKVTCKRSNLLEKEEYYYYELIVTRQFKFDSLVKLGSIIIGHKICDQNELNEYLHMFDNRLLGKKKKNKFLKNLEIFYNKNVFEDEFRISEERKKEKVVREKKSLGTSIMENIEYLLLNIKSNNQEFYSKVRNKYEELLKNPNLSNQMLAMFEGELEASLLFGNHEVNDILEYLNNLKKEYLTNYLNNSLEKTDLTLEKINKINELFLKVKDKYNLLNQREVLKNLAFLYVMEIYENKEIITLEELENSYFADNLKSIVICVKSLQELGLINCNYLIDIVEELSCKIVFDMIRNIKFRDLQEEQVKELVKSF